MNSLRLSSPGSSCNTSSSALDRYDFMTGSVNFEEVRQLLESSLEGKEGVLTEKDNSLILKFSHNEISNEELISAFIDILQTKPNINRIIFAQGSFNDTCWMKLLELIRDSELDGLILGFFDVKLTPVQLGYFKDAGKSERWPIKGYDFHNSGDLAGVIELLRVNRTYKYLRISKMGVSDSALENCKDVMLGVLSLENLSLVNNPLTDASVPLLCNIIKDSKNLSNLNIGELSSNGILKISRLGREALNSTWSAKRTLAQCQKLSEILGKRKEQEETVEDRRRVLAKIGQSQRSLAFQNYSTFLGLLTRDFEHHKIPNDGACFFHAVFQGVQQYYPNLEESLNELCEKAGIPSSHSGHFKLRLLTVKYLEDNYSTTKDFFLSRKDFDDHCSKMKMVKEWATQTEHVGLFTYLRCSGFNVSLVIYDLEHNPVIDDEGHIVMPEMLSPLAGTKIIHLFHPPGHFDLLIPRKR